MKRVLVVSTWSRPLWKLIFSKYCVNHNVSRSIHWTFALSSDQLVFCLTTNHHKQKMKAVSFRIIAQPENVHYILVFLGTQTRTLNHGRKALCEVQMVLSLTPLHSDHSWGACMYRQCRSFLPWRRWHRKKKKEKKRPSLQTPKANTQTVLPLRLPNPSFLLLGAWCPRKIKAVSMIWSFHAVINAHFRLPWNVNGTFLCFCLTSYFFRLLELGLWSFLKLQCTVIYYSVLLCPISSSFKLIYMHFLSTYCPLVLIHSVESVCTTNHHSVWRIHSAAWGRQLNLVKGKLANLFKWLVLDLISPRIEGISWIGLQKTQMFHLQSNAAFLRPNPWLLEQPQQKYFQSELHYFCMQLCLNIPQISSSSWNKAEEFAHENTAHKQGQSTHKTCMKHQQDECSKNECIWGVKNELI